MNDCQSSYIKKMGVEKKKGERLLVTLFLFYFWVSQLPKFQRKINSLKNCKIIGR
jgi:hypothetical protein